MWFGNIGGLRNEKFRINHNENGLRNPSNMKLHFPPNVEGGEKSHII